MSDKQIQSLDDIVFEHRNKSYGAYRLRNNEKGYLTRAFIIGVAIFIIFIIILYFYNSLQAKKVVINKDVKVELQNIDEPKEEEIIEIKPEEPQAPPPPPPKQEEVAQVKMVMPEPKKAINKKEEPIPTKEEADSKRLGLENKEGKQDNNNNDNNNNNNNNNNNSNNNNNDNNNNNEPYDKVEQEAQYPGGINKLRDFVARRLEYPSKALDKGTEGRVMVKFIVEKDGSVSGIQILKDIGDGCGAEVVRIIKQTKKWSPALVNGKPVRSYYRFPVVFRLPPQ